MPIFYCPCLVSQKRLFLFSLIKSQNVAILVKPIVNVMNSVTQIVLRRLQWGKVRLCHRFCQDYSAPQGVVKTAAGAKRIFITMKTIIILKGQDTRLLVNRRSVLSARAFASTIKARSEFQASACCRQLPSRKLQLKVKGTRHQTTVHANLAVLENKIPGWESNVAYGPVTCSLLGLIRFWNRKRRMWG